MEQVSTIRDLVALWPSRAAFAEDLGRPIARVHKWITNNAIPAREHLGVIRAAHCRGYPVSAELLVRLHAPAPDGEAAA